MGLQGSDNMEKIEKIFDSNWGIVIFYIFIAIIAFMMVQGSSPSGSQISNHKESRVTYYA